MVFTTFDSKPSFDEMEVKFMEAFCAEAVKNNSGQRDNNIYLVNTIGKAIGQ
jgi:hypothetical protein